jgi:hypothetical protein
MTHPIAVAKPRRPTGINNLYVVPKIIPPAKIAKLISAVR